VSFSFKDANHINDGTNISEVVKLFRDHPSVFAMGVNCTHPKYISDIIQNIKACQLNKRIIVYPNSGEAYHAQEQNMDGHF
jgi:homocysteine S-methyltransferase